MRARLVFLWAIAAIALAGNAFAGCLRSTILNVNDPAPAVDHHFGQTVASLGDLNGDGTADLAVGAPGGDRVVIFSGATRAVIRTIPDPDGAAAEGTDFGFAIIAAGDVNGDGVSDLAIGARGVDNIVPLPCPVDPPCNPAPEQGRAFLFSGANGALIRRLQPTDNEFLAFGFSLASLGDITGDGVPDIAVGSPTRRNNFWGQVFAFSGANGAVLWLAKEPKQTLASMGHSLASVADINGDGKRDLIAGAIFHDIGGSTLVGRAYVLSGATGAQIRIHENPLGNAGKSFGAAVAAIGDQSGDGSEDYAVSDPGASRTYLFNGANGAALATIGSPDSSSTDYFGIDVAENDDYDGDGKKDLSVGATRSGKLWLLNRNAAVITQINDPTPGPQPNELGFAWSLDPSPNLGGDSGRDLLIGEPAANGVGAAYIALLHMNKVPDAVAGPDQVVECEGENTVITLDGSASSDLDGDTLSYEWRDSANQVVGTAATLTLLRATGNYTFTLKVSDGCDSDTDSVTITVQDTTGPNLTVSLSPEELRPPNHKLVEVTASINVEDACDPGPTVILLSITSDEPDNGSGDGDTTDDIQGAGYGTDDRTFLLRAERAGSGDGRTYTVTYQATDAFGNTTSHSAEVHVPRGR